MIIKIQKSLIHNSVLIYSKNREIIYENYLTPEIKKILGNDYKAYFKAELNNNNELIIIEKTKQENW